MNRSRSVSDTGDAATTNVTRSMAAVTISSRFGVISAASHFAVGLALGIREDAQHG